MAQQPTISSTERIRDLSAISADVPSLLTSASATLSALTGRAQPQDGDMSLSPTNGAASASLQDSKAAFTQNAQAYFITLQALMARLRRQAYALEEAGIIAAEAPVLQQTQSNPQQQAGRPNINQGAGVRRNVVGPAPGVGGGQQKAQEDAERITHGGLGDLDVAWLNSRVGNGGLEKEGEVLAGVKRLLEDVLQAKDQRDTDMTDRPE
ncbi:hypothetical protein ANO11243_012090 [Dothideomycetidae sp. 11243]|nr:hypothetical protein ANO11243_012090 [fungal sp. No.11243]